jgi:hypothetical protein
MCALAPPASRAARPRLAARRAAHRARARARARAAGFCLLLALASTVAGLAVSCKIRNIADVEPSLRSYAHEKMVKVALAAAVFSACSLCRAYVMLREALDAFGAELPPLSYVTLGVLVPELLPTIAALIVLRRRPIGCCGLSCCGEDGVLARLVCCWSDRHVAGVDMTPLRDGERA